MADEPDPAQPQPRSVSIKGDTIVTTNELAEWCDCSPQTIETYASRNIVVRVARGQYMLKASLKNFIAHLRSEKGGANSPTIPLKARLLASQARQAERKEAILAGEFLSAAEHEAEMAQLVAISRSGLLALPSRLAGRFPYLTPPEIAEIESEVRSIMTEMSSGDIPTGPESPSGLHTAEAA